MSVLFYGCVLEREPFPKNFVRITNKDSIAKYGLNKVRLNGFYTEQSLNYYAVRPLFFYGNGLVVYKEFQFTDSTFKLYDFKSEYYKSMGVYEVKNDTVRATFYRVYEVRAHMAKYKVIRYEGILKDTVTITNWRVVEPFPKFKKRDDLINPMGVCCQKPVDLIFKPFKWKAEVDSNDAWIYKPMEW